MEILDNLDIFEVDKEDYDSYFYRLPINDMMKTTPREGLTIYKDITNSGAPVCGILSEQVMAMPANRYFIFELINEERLGPHKVVKHVHLGEAQYTEFLARLQDLTKERKEDA